jgi:hypothetical protein
VQGTGGRWRPSLGQERRSSFQDWPRLSPPTITIDDDDDDDDKHDNDDDDDDVNDDDDDKHDIDDDAMNDWITKRYAFPVQGLGVYRDHLLHALVQAFH